jgi:membrane-associated phospholipid phosphatase
MRAQPKTALFGAAVGIVLLIAVWFAAFHIGVLEHADRSIFGGFLGLGTHGRIHALAEFVAGLCDPRPYVYFAVIPVLIGLARRRPRVALGAAAILVGGNVTTQLLKPLLAEPRTAAHLAGVSGVSAASWPSGHATAAMALALACVLVAPARLRPFVAALGAGFAVAVSYSFLALGWHYPSDVLGGFLVAATWALLVVAALLAVDKRTARPATARRLPIGEALAPPVAALVGAVALAAAVALVRPHQVVSYVRAHEAFTVGAAGIGVLAVALATSVMLAFRR